MPDFIELLRQDIDQIDGPITRQKLIKRRNIRKAARKRDPLAAEVNVPAAAFPGADNDTSIPGDPVNIASDAAFSVVLADLRNQSDIVQLSKDYVIGGEPAALKVGGQMTFDSTFVAIFRLADVCSVAGKLSFWSKGRFDRIFLSQPTGAPDVTDEIVVAVCAKNVPEIIDQLMFKPVNVDPATFCLGFLKDLPGRHLHLFAAKETSGWSSVIGKDNWAVGVAAVSSNP